MNTNPTFPLNTYYNRIMKRLFVSLCCTLLAFTAFSQPPQEIIDSMDEAMSKHENEGVVMTIDIKMPIIGTMSTKSYMLGDKMRMEATMLGETITTWSDGATDWTYNSKKQEIEITHSDGSTQEESGDTEMFHGITDGYDVSLKKETADAWHIQCKKSKDNKEKDDPKNIDLVIAKGSYYPISLTTKMKGVTLTMYDISFGVTESQVTFNPSDYPNATIVDKR